MDHDSETCMKTVELPMHDGHFILVSHDQLVLQLQYLAIFPPQKHGVYSQICKLWLFDIEGLAGKLVS